MQWEEHRDCLVYCQPLPLTESLSLDRIIFRVSINYIMIHQLMRTEYLQNYYIYINWDVILFVLSALPPIPAPPQAAQAVSQYQYHLPQSQYQYQPTPSQYQYQPQVQQPLPPPQPRVNLPYQPPRVISDVQYQQQLQYDHTSSSYFEPSPLDKKVGKLYKNKVL